MLQICEQDSRCNRLSLESLLLAPMQHWTRVPLILKRICKYTTNQHDLQELKESRNKVELSLRKCPHLNNMPYENGDNNY